MPTREWKFRILDMLDSIDRVASYVSGMALEDFVLDQKTMDAVVRSIELIGEAANHVPKDTREKYPGVPWIDIVGMRNLVIHGYFFVDPNIVWRVARESLPRLKLAIEELRAAERF